MSDAVMPCVRTCFLRFKGLEGDESTGRSTLASLRNSRRPLARLPGEAMLRMENVKSPPQLSASDKTAARQWRGACSTVEQQSFRSSSRW